MHTFLVILLTDRQTGKQTRAKHMPPSLSEVNNVAHNMADPSMYEHVQSEGNNVNMSSYD